MKVLIPTCRTYDEILPQIEVIRSVTFSEVEIIASCSKASASVNRNICLDALDVGEIAIMLDDDIRGFYSWWIVDLLQGLTIPNAAMVSARLLNEDGTFGPTCSRRMEPEPQEIELQWDRPHCIMPTAAIAFRHLGFRFDENFVGSGFEDNDWMKQYAAADPSAKFIQSNRCRLIHINEMKNQKGQYWQHNRTYFFAKWGKESSNA